MTVDRRLDKIAASLTPTQRVVAWLEEAHAYDHFESYTRSLLGQPPAAFPINRLHWDAVAAAKAAMRGKPPEEVDRAVRKELRETVLRYQLVVRLNVTAQELIDHQGLFYLVIVSQVAILLLRQEHEPASVPDYLGQLARMRDLAARRVDELLAHEAARAAVEARYLDGYPALFPAVATTWAERLEELQMATVMADRLAELDGVPPGVIHDPEWVAARTAVLVGDLVDRAKVETLEKLDEPRHAFRIADRWLHTMLAPTAAEDDQSPAEAARAG